METYRGTVFRWEVDANDHLTVAYYLSRFGDAAANILHALGLSAAVTVDCYIRYSRELRVGDLMHVESAVIGVEAEGLVLGHKLLESTERALCTTVEHRLAVALSPDRGDLGRRDAARPGVAGAASGRPSVARGRALRAGRVPEAGDLRQQRGERLVDAVGGGEVVGQACLDLRLCLERDPDGLLEAENATHDVRCGGRSLRAAGQW
jgi:acyl-CoA thioesterase FadM